MHLKSLVLLLLFFALILNVYAQTFVDNILTKINNLTTTGDSENARKKKKDGDKYITPLLIGALLIKSIIFPLAFKAMAVMTNISVLIGTMSLIISSIVGYAKLGEKSGVSSVKVVHKQPYNIWAKDDENSMKNYYAPVGNYDFMAPPPQEF